MVRVGGRRAVAGALLAGCGWTAWMAEGCSSSSSQRNVLVNDDGSAGSPGGASGAGGRGGTNASGGSGARAGTNGGGGSSGSAGTIGSGGSTGGTSGGPADANGGTSGSSPGDAGDAAPDAGGTPVPIQRIQDGTVAAGQTAAVEKVFVTAFRQTVGGEMSFVVQEPQGDTPPQYAYPEYAGLGVFIRVDGGPVTPPAVGDCVDVTGVVEEFQGRTQLANGSFAAATNCGTFPAPLEVPSPQASFEDIATDRDPSPPNEPGAKAEVYESVLVRVSAVHVISVPTTLRFDIVEQVDPAGPWLIVQSVYHSQNPPVGQDYAAITGIMSEANGEYRLLPRSAADFFQ